MKRRSGSKLYSNEGSNLEVMIERVYSRSINADNKDDEDHFADIYSTLQDRYEEIYGHRYEHRRIEE